MIRIDATGRLTRRTSTALRMLKTVGAIIFVVIGILGVKYDSSEVNKISTSSGSLSFKTGDKHLIYSIKNLAGNNLIQIAVNIHSLSWPDDRIAICVFPNDIKPLYTRNIPCGGYIEAQVIPEAAGNDGDDVIVESSHVYALFTSEQNKKWEVYIENHNLLKPINVEFTVKSEMIARNTLKYWWLTLSYLTGKVSFLFRSLGIKLQGITPKKDTISLRDWMQQLRPASCASFARIPWLYHATAECKLIMNRFQSYLIQSS